MDSTFPENIGKVVEVVSAYGPFLDEGFCWNVRASMPLKGEGDIDGTVMMCTEGFIDDSQLRPISGVPMHDDVTDEVSA
ncbi:hypothetical protein [Paraburkholderia sp. 22B1P]|uniref:hypothetical protein n=1 Tax=Paraburkholderia sp. 22B1P TaxID=3080498 RepID=UPI0030D04986